jgi:DNA-binding NarL/FixJ family response regulator
MEGKILYLEDDPLWIQEIKNMLDKKYDFISVSTLRDAAQVITNIARKGEFIDLAIVDISLIRNNGDNQDGFVLIDALERSGLLPEFKIIVLTGYEGNIRSSLSEFDVIDVFIKANWAKEKESFLNLVNNTIIKFS